MTRSEKPQSQFLQGVLMVMLGAVCFSSKAIFVKLAYRHESIDPASLLALRMAFSLPFFVIAAVLSSAKISNIRFTPLQWIKVGAIGCLGYYVSSFLDFQGLQFVNAGIERLILFTYPTLVLIITLAIYRTRVKPMQWLALTLSYLGLAIAYVGEINFQAAPSPDFIKGSLFVFGCAVTYAFYIVGSGRIIPVVGATKFNSYAMSFASIGVFVHYILFGDRSLLEFSVPVYTYALLMAVFSTVIPTYLVAAGIKRIGSGNAAIVSSVGPVSTIIMAYFFLQESVSTLQLIGTGFIIIGVWLIGGKSEN